MGLQSKFTIFMSDTDVTKEYGNLKLSLWKEFEHNRDGYTNAKSDFILHYSSLAKQEFKNRYKL